MFAKIISTYPAPDTSDQCFFVIQYSVDGITYQKKFLDKTFGLLPTEKFLEVVINNNDSKNAVLAVEVDHYDTHGPRDLYHLRYACNIVTLLLPFFLLIYDCAPNMSTHLLGSSVQHQCLLTTWIDALAHYFIILALFPFQHFLNNHRQGRKKRTFNLWLLI